MLAHGDSMREVGIGGGKYVSASDPKCETVLTNLSRTENAAFA